MYDPFNPMMNTSPSQMSLQSARQLQNRLAPCVAHTRRVGSVHNVAGIDVALKGNTLWAAVVVLAYPELKPIDQATASATRAFPYIPGLLSFREGPVIIDAYLKLAVEPDLLIFDGQGIAHPRRFGVASHLGLLLDKPSIGCAKSRLCGSYTQPGPTRGDHAFLRDNNEIIGAVLRTRNNVKPVFVSIGHRVDLKTCIAYVLACCSKFRLPETTRHAHRLARQACMTSSSSGTKPGKGRI